MASPSASEVDKQNADSEQISFRFCRECSNMLYPKEDRLTNTLLFACRTCNFSEPAPSSCIYRNQLSNTVGETAGVTQDVGNDPTLPRSNKECPNCRETECVFFQSQQRTSETGMQLFYVCCGCGTIFK